MSVIWMSGEAVNDRFVTVERKSKSIGGGMWGMVRELVRLRPDRELESSVYLLLCNRVSSSLPELAKRWRFLRIGRMSLF